MPYLFYTLISYLRLLTGTLEWSLVQRKATLQPSTTREMEPHWAIRLLDWREDWRWVVGIVMGTASEAREPHALRTWTRKR